MDIKIVFLLTVSIVLASAKKDYTNHKVYKVIPRSEEQVKYVESLDKIIGIDFWDEHVIVDHEIKVMVSPENQEQFEAKVYDNAIESTLVIENVQKLVDAQLKRAPKHARNQAYSIDEYHNLEEIYSWLDALASTYPDVASTVVIGQSNEGRDIKGIIINFKKDEGSDRLIAMLEGGIHAREWISPSTISWIINEFLTSNDPEIRTLVDNFEWHIFPVVNPDGYSYTFTNNRMWRKNRNTENFTSCATSGVADDLSNGVDLNRNFDFVWMSVGASDNPCLNTYAGRSPFSEPETRAIQQYVLKLHNEGNFMYYIAFHSYTQLLLVPYSNVLSGNTLQANNFADMFEVATRGAERIEQRYGTQYRVGLSVDLMYQMSGTSFDWVKYATNVPMSYLFELRDLGEFGFLLPSEQIIPTGLEMMDGLVEMDKTSRRLGYYTSASSPVMFSVVCLAISAFFAVMLN